MRIRWRRPVEPAVVVALVIQAAIFVLPFWAVQFIAASGAGIAWLLAPKRDASTELVIDADGISWLEIGQRRRAYPWAQITDLSLGSEDPVLSVQTSGRTIFQRIPLLLSPAEFRDAQAAIRLHAPAALKAL
nr:PH domain-containing protein [Erythrobacter ramosus]